MAKQRHILSRISDDSSDNNKSDIAVQNNEIRPSYRIKPFWCLTFVTLSFLSIMVLIFQFEIILPFYVMNISDNESGGDVREAIISCEWSGNVYYDLKTKLGVSYEANHWYVTCI